MPIYDPLAEVTNGGWMEVGGWVRWIRGLNTFVIYVHRTVLSYFTLSNNIFTQRSCNKCFVAVHTRPLFSDLPTVASPVASQEFYPFFSSPFSIQFVVFLICWASDALMSTLPPVLLSRVDLSARWPLFFTLGLVFVSVWLARHLDVDSVNTSSCIFLVSY